MLPDRTMSTTHGDDHYATAEAIRDRVLACRAAHGGALLLATDFDGTIAPIAARPERARGEQEALAALRAMRRAGVITCVVTGRALNDVESLLGRDHGCEVVAEHGAALALTDGTRTREEPTVEARAALASLEARAAAVVHALPGARMELKPSAFAVHVRGVDAAARGGVASLLDELAAEARRRGLEAIAGREVLEVRPHLSNKGRALAALHARLAPDAALVYAGDDTTDVPALAVAAPRCTAVYVASIERPHPPDIPGLMVTIQPRWVEALCLLAEALGPAQGR